MKKIFTFHGAGKDCGCAWLSRRTAEILAGKRGDLKILLVHASHSDAAPAGAVRASMERIRPYLAAGKDLPLGIAERTGCAGDLSVISGAGPCERSGVFYPDMSEAFMKRMSLEYDVVICDSGSDIDQGLPLGAMFASDSIYTVFSPTEESFRGFEWLRPLYEKLSLNLNGYVLDRFPADSGYSEDLVADRLGVGSDRVFMIPEAGLRTDLEKLADDIIKDASSAPVNVAI